MKFLISIIYLLSFSTIAQERDFEFDVEAAIPEPRIDISVIGCGATTATVRICNYGTDVEVSNDEIVTVFGFAPTDLVEAPPKEVVIVDPIDGEDFTPTPTPVDRMESELLGKYLVPKNIPFETETNEIKPDQCIDIKFHNRLDDLTDLIQDNFSCDIPITASIGTPSGSTIARKIDLLGIDGEKNETR